MNFFSIGQSCFMMVFWLEINGVLLIFFMLFNSATSAVTSYSVGVLKETWDNTWISFLNHRTQTKHQSSFLFSLKVELVLLLAIWIPWVLGLFSCLQVIEFTGRRSCCGMLTWKATILISKKFSIYHLLASLYVIIQPNHFPQLVNTITK